MIKSIRFFFVTIFLIIIGGFWVSSCLETMPESQYIEPISSLVSIYSGADIIGHGWGFSTGLVATASHVVERQQNIWISLSNNQRRSVSRISDDPLLDLSVLRLSPQDPFPSPSFSLPSIGEEIFIHSLTGSVISFPESLSTDNHDLFHLVRTNIPIDLGLSGSPVFDSSGTVLGLVIAREDSKNFAMFISPDLIRPALDIYAREGEIIRPFLGTRSRVISLESYHGIGQPYGSLITGNHDRGEFAITPNSPAQGAGLRGGDIILSLDENSITSTDPLDFILLQYSPGDSPMITFWREGEKETAQVTLAPQ